MADLVDNTYFVKEINVPSSTFSNLGNYITRFEKEVLIRLLGYELYKTYTEWNGTDAGVIKDLVEGKEYTNGDGNLIKWNGLQNDDKLSLISYYVFYKWLKDQVIIAQTTGTKQSTSENSLIADSGQKLVLAWRNFLELYNPQYEDTPSAYNFLMNHESDYPTWDFEYIGTVNNWDL